MSGLFFYLTKCVSLYNIEDVLLCTEIPGEEVGNKDCERMINGYMTIKEVAEKWGITVRRVQALCETDRLEGATKFGNAWAIPTDVKRPTDGRVTTGEYKNWRKKYGKDKEEGE